MTEKDKEQAKLFWNKIKNDGNLFFSNEKYSPKLIADHGKYSSTIICNHTINDEEFNEFVEIIDNCEPIEINLIQKKEFNIDVLNNDDNISKALKLIDKGIIDEVILLNEHSLRLKKTIEYKQKCYENKDYCVGLFEI